jgi:hypothetical protein
MVIWCSLWSFGTVYGHLVYFFRFWYAWTMKNLATLLSSNIARCRCNKTNKEEKIKRYCLPSQATLAQRLQQEYQEPFHFFLSVKPPLPLRVNEKNFLATKTRPNKEN